MKNGIAAVVMFLHVTGCALSSDEEYIGCLQAANTVGSLALVPAGAAAEVIAAGGSRRGVCADTVQRGRDHNRAK